MTLAEMKAEVLQRVGIPDYVYDIVLPNMPEYYDGDYEVDFEVSRYMKCCFHSEDSPSLRWYEETGTYYCFGCGKGGRGPMGTVIGFHINFAEKMNGKKPTENEAVRFLYSYFIEERDVRSTFVPSSVDKKSDNGAEISAFNMYKNEVEKSIVYDRTLAMDKKVSMYDTLDNIDTMLFKGIIEVNEARAEIEKCIRKLITV